MSGDYVKTPTRCPVIVFFFAMSPIFLHNLICSYITTVTQHGSAPTSEHIHHVAVFLLFLQNGIFFGQHWNVEHTTTQYAELSET